MGGDFEMIFLIFDEGIFVNIAEEKSEKKRSKDPQDFLLYIADRVKDLL